MKVKEAIAQLEIDIKSLDTLKDMSSGEQFLIRKRAYEEKKLILRVYKTIDPEAEILIADVNLLITLN